MWKYLILLLLSIAFLACNDDFQPDDDGSSLLVVEGWIEDGGYPVVILTRTLPVSTSYQRADDLKDYLLKWAKVIVSDGTDSVILTGKYDDAYFPPYIYTTTAMKGKAGKEYSLTVEYNDYQAHAITRIPAKPQECSFRVERCDDSDTLCQITAIFQDDPTEKNYYQFFTCVGTASKQYLASYLGTLDDTVLHSVTEIPVYRGHHFMLDDYTPYFALNDTVSVKFAHIDETSFRIWDSYIKTLSLSGNMFLTTSSNIETNISGGYGYWCGYGAITRYIVISDSIR